MHHLRAWRLVFLLTATLWCAAWAHAQGVVVAMGGAVKDDSPMWAEVVRLAGGPGARFVVFTMSSEDPDASAAALLRQVARHGAKAEHVRVGPRFNAAGLAASERDAPWLQAVRSAQGALFSGGDQSLITQTLAPGGEPTPLLLALREMVRRGGVVAGSSAGAAVMSRRMFTGGNPLEVMKGTQAGETVAAGLGFIGADVLVDQHFLKRGRIGRLLPTLQREGLVLGLGVDEDSGIVVRGEDVEVIGSRGALLVDLRSAQHDRSLSEFNIRGAVLSYLEAGDRLNLASLAVTPAPAKAAGRAVAPPPANFRPYWSGPVFFADMLSDFTIVSAMQQLVDSRRTEVTGLAFHALAGAGERKADLGFEWILSRGPDTAAWNVGDRYSIAQVQLEVRPVRVARPLFTPWR